MDRYVFNPLLNAPLRYVHPLQAGAVAHIAGQSFSQDIEYIILFGSSLNLTCGATSDLDLYVISEHEPEAVYKEVYDHCKNMGRPFDILVSTMEDFDEEKLVPGTVENQVLREGLCVYAKTKNSLLWQIAVYQAGK